MPAEPIQVIKRPGGTLLPAHQNDADALMKVKNGSVLAINFKQPRNPMFHRKFMAMLNFAFEYWEPKPEAINSKVIEAEKNFDKFRKDVLIYAGFRKTVVNLKNEVRYEAESISFSNMDEQKFNYVYKKVFNVLWKFVLSEVPGMSENEAESVINQMLSFS